ncbi:hypothetical protein MESS4_160017 [Mesorhizobium sp. STM 4661]|nr:hypothetical protein MESS4_160017 [Mesorhizobium sp. STM 4661]
MQKESRILWIPHAQDAPAPDHSVGALNHGHIHPASQPEADGLVQCYGRDVGGVGVEIGNFAARHDPIRHEQGQQPSQAATAKIRMRAHAAELGMARLLHAFASHRGKSALDFHAPEIAEAQRLQREWGRAW